MTVVGTLLGLACLVFFLHQLRTQWDSVRHIPWDQGLTVRLVAACGIYLATYLSSAYSWKYCLAVLDLRIRAMDALRIVLISQFAKYLPGNVAHHIGRVFMTRRLGMNAGLVVTSIVMDMVLIMIAGLICSLGAIELVVIVTERYGMTDVAGFWIGIGFGVALAVALTVRPLRQHVKAFLSRVLSQTSTARSRLTLALALLFHTGNFLLGSFALWLVSGGFLGGADSLPLLPVIGIYSTAWLVGFLVPGAPAGLGVREAVMLVGLSSFMPPGEAVTSTALMRIATVIGDGGAFLIGHLMRQGATMPR